MDYWVEIKSLSAHGLGIRAIARKLSISRNRVRRVLRGTLSSPAEQLKRPFSKVLPFEKDILAMLGKKLIGTRIVNELRKIGYTGGATLVYLYLQALGEKNPRFKEKATVRFETEPGFQAQFDWSPYKIVLGGVLTRVVVYDLILAHSRRKLYWPSFQETQEAVFEAIEQGFIHFGGVTKEILVDNAKALVKDARPEHFEWNDRFLDFCKHYDILPHACQVRRSQTKGKVERPFSYLENHFIKGRDFLNFADFVRQLKDFNRELDYRIHQTLRVIPMERFEEESPFLKPLPATRFFGGNTLVRKVSLDCLISFDGTRYSVPHMYAGSEVCAKVSQGHVIEIYSRGGEKIAQHQIQRKKGAMVIDEHHYEGLRKQSPRTMVNLRASFLDSFPDQQAFLEKLAALHKGNTYLHLRTILELAKLFPHDAMRDAFTQATAYQAFSSKFIRGILEAHSTVATETDSMMTMVNVPHLQFSRGLKDYSILQPTQERRTR